MTLDTLIEHGKQLTEQPHQALELWRQWWDYNGNPWVGDTTDHGYPDACFFCNGERDKGHDKDCVYLLVANLLGEELVA